MGQMLSEPVKNLRQWEGEDTRVAFNAGDMQGWRCSMEDAHSNIMDLLGEQDLADKADAEARETEKRDTDDEDKAEGGSGGGAEPSGTSSSNASPAYSYFAVYDGHGGAGAAHFAQHVTWRKISRGLLAQGKHEEALQRAFLDTDEDLRTSTWMPDERSGCTAVGILLAPDYTIYCANAGDSRCVMSVDGECVELSKDHKPTLDEERDRIVNAGGFVQFGRVNGNLALSRAIGDLGMKDNTSLPPEKQAVTAFPEVVRHDPTDKDEFVIIACDGIWDVLKSQEAVDFVRRRVAEGQPLKSITDEVINSCVSPVVDLVGGGCDNMTFMVVALLKGRSVEQWYADVRARVDAHDSYPTPQQPNKPDYNKGLASPEMQNVFSSQTPVTLERSDPNHPLYGADDSTVVLPQQSVEAIIKSISGSIDDDDTNEERFYNHDFDEDDDE